jgi:hypothetical protein
MTPAKVSDDASQLQVVPAFDRQQRVAFRDLESRRCADYSVASVSE